MGKEKMAPVVEKNKELKLGKVMNLGITMDEKGCRWLLFCKIFETLEGYVCKS